MAFPIPFNPDKEPYIDPPVPIPWYTEVYYFKEYSDWTYYLGCTETVRARSSIWYEWSWIIICSIYFTTFNSIIMDRNMELTMHTSIVNIFNESNEKAQEKVLEEAKKESSMYFEKVKTTIDDNFRGRESSDLSDEKMIEKYMSDQKRSMILRIVCHLMTDLVWSISSILSLLSLLLMSFDTTGLINLFYVVFWLVFLYQMKNFIFQKNWKFPYYLEKVLKPFVYFEIWVQILFQVPFNAMHSGEDKENSWQNIIGVFRLWTSDEENINSTDHQGDLIIKSLMLVFIILQENIFTSIDYQKFRDSKLANIVRVSEIKSRCLTYIYNNKKIKKVIKIQYEKRNMMKKLAIVSKQVAQWNRNRDIECVSDEEQEEEATSLKTKAKDKRDSMISDDVQIVGKPAFNSSTKKRLSKSYSSVTDIGNGTRFSEHQKPTLDKHASAADRYKIETIPEDKITPKRRGGHVIKTFSFEQLDIKARSSIQSFLEEKMLDEEILLQKLMTEKLNFPLKIMVWVRSNLTNEVLVKVDYDVLTQTEERLEGGWVSVRTKIEEALLRDYKNRQELDFYENDEDDYKKNLKEKEDEHINAFKKWHVILYESIKLIAKLAVSNTSNFWYIFMIIAHIENGTLLSLVYPISIFAYALLEETRPKNTYWLFIIVFTWFVLFFKYMFQTFPLSTAISDDTNADLKTSRIGLYVNSSSERSFLAFYVFEILVLMFSILHVLKLISTGLWTKRETDIEDIEETVHRLYQSQAKQKDEFHHLFRALKYGKNFNYDLKENLVPEL